jgi:outer membrane protein insertion porin family
MWMRRLTGGSAAFFFFLLPCIRGAELSNPSNFTGKRVMLVRFEPANQPLTKEQLERHFPLKQGSVLNANDVRSAIKTLYATGRYSDVEIDAEPAGTLGMALIIRTSSQWFVGPVEVHGKIKQPPNRGQLVNATQLQLGSPFNEEDLRAATQGVQNLLQRNGLYGSTVEPQVTQDAAHQQVYITFLVKTRKRARLTTPVITGDTRLPPAKVAAATKYKGWFRWKPATEDNVVAGVRNVRAKYEKQDRLTADVRLTHREYEAADNRVKPTIDANGGPKVKIRTSGGKLSKGKLQQYVPVFDEQTVNRDLLVQGASNLRDYFQLQGYFDADVDFRTQHPSADEEDITYVLELGPRHKLVSVQIRGNHYFRTQDIRDRMFLQPSGFIRLRHGRYSEAFVRRDKDAIEALYHANGFRDVKVTADTIDDYKGKTGNVAVTVTIDEGPQYLVSGFTLNGIYQLKQEDLLSRLALSGGQPFSEYNVGVDRGLILRTYQAAGFPDVAFDWKMTPGPGDHQYSVQYYVTEGMRQYVRDLLITGLHHTKRKLVNPAMTLKAGDPLSWTAMGNMQRDLYNLGVFDDVNMAIQNPDGDTNDKYVIYQFTEGHRYTVALGAGAEIAQIGGSQTSLSNPQGQTGFSPRGSLEVDRMDMFGLGHTLSFRSRASALDDLVSLNYLMPQYHNVQGRNISITGLYDNERDVRTFAASRVEGDIELSQKLSKPTTLFLRYTYRDTRINQSTLKINPLLIPLYSQPALIGEVSANLVQDRRDNPVNAHRGIYNTVDVGLASKPFGSHTSFGRLLFHNSYYHPVFGDMVLASNTEFGIIAPFGVPAGETGADYIPLAERFFGGGSTSERGFPDNQAGPRDPYTGFPIGGNALLFHSTELRFPLIGDNIGGVIFHDMGNIYSSVSAISFSVTQKNLTDFDYMNHAVGFGIRYNTPLGPVRVDLAYSINPPTFNGLQGTYQQLLFGGATRVIQSVSHFQFFFSIGQAF